MKKYKAYRVAVKFPCLEHWYFTWKVECETFDLDRFAWKFEAFNEFDPFNPETNVVYELFGKDGKLIKRTDSLALWMNWMESVKEVF